jgi:hypothetical protein
MSFSTAGPADDDGAAPGAAPGHILIVGRSAAGGHPDWADNKAVDAATTATRITNLRAFMCYSLPCKNVAPMIAGATPLTQIANGIGRAR